MKKKTSSQPKRNRSIRNQHPVAGKRPNHKKTSDEAAPSPWLKIFTAGSENRPR
jgi:hypothetical protein